jgi:hypothetical protein
MRAELGLPSVRGDDEKGGGMMGGFGGSMGGVGGAGGKAKRPIGVKFEIPYFTTSGIQVRYLKIIEPKVCLARFLLKLEDSSTDFFLSYNTPPCLGCDTSLRAEILLCVCRTCSNGMDELAATNCYRLDLMLSMAMAYWRVEECFSEYCRGHYDSAPGAAITEIRLSTTCATDTMESSSHEQHQAVPNRNNLNQGSSCDGSLDAMVLRTFP